MKIIAANAKARSEDSLQTNADDTRDEDTSMIDQSVERNDQEKNNDSNKISVKPPEIIKKPINALPLKPAKITTITKEETSQQHTAHIVMPLKKINTQTEIKPLKSTKVVTTFKIAKSIKPQQRTVAPIKNTAGLKKNLNIKNQTKPIETKLNKKLPVKVVSGEKTQNDY